MNTGDLWCWLITRITKPIRGKHIHSPYFRGTNLWLFDEKIINNDKMDSFVVVISLIIPLLNYAN